MSFHLKTAPSASCSTFFNEYCTQSRIDVMCRRRSNALFWISNGFMKPVSLPHLGHWPPVRCKGSSLFLPREWKREGNLSRGRSLVKIFFPEQRAIRWDSNCCFQETLSLCKRSAVAAPNFAELRVLTNFSFAVKFLKLLTSCDEINQRKCSPKCLDRQSKENQSSTWGFDINNAKSLSLDNLKSEN